MPLKDILARNELLREQGKLPGAKGTGTRVDVPALPPKRVPLKIAPCAHLGARIGHSCGSVLRQCAHFSDITTQLTPCREAQRCCQTCADYAPEEGAP